MATAATISTPQPGPPDISYKPDMAKYLARTKRRQECENLETTLPEGFPTQLKSDLVWEGQNLEEKYNWNYELTSSDVGEIEAALRHFQSLNKPLGEISQTTFPLPTLHPILREISQEIHAGHGFKVVRGVPVSRYTREENIAIFAGISSHVAPIRGRQDREYQGRPADVVLAHIKDLSSVIDADRIGQPAYTTEKQVFHTDIGDIIALFALAESASGGESYLSSSWRVYNELASTRPDLIRTLAEPWAFDEYGKGVRPYTPRPLLHHQPATEDTPERLLIQYARRNFTGYWSLPRSPDIPVITEAQAEALDALHFLAEKYAVSLDFRAGDIQYVNNLSIFHARNGFQDSPDKQRHLVRFWLRDPELSWKTPEVLQDRWDKVYADRSVEKEVFPLEPVIRSQ
ncbi:hypothetical protein F4679DRAFT_590183 [Xylaria curta]|nr:hypothetical protein F4679DRAFT_590183 [Xylaria curta]